MEKLGRIRTANLEITDRGVLDFWIVVDCDTGGTEGFGRFPFNERRKMGTAQTCEMIKDLLFEFGVDVFSDMVGLFVWVGHDGFKATSVRPYGSGIDRG